MNILFWLIVMILLPPILFASANMLDFVAMAIKKRVTVECGVEVEHDMSSVAYIAMTALIECALVLLPLAIVCLMTGTFPMGGVFVTLFLNGISATAFVWLYLKAYGIEEDITKVIPWYQTIPIFGLVLAWLRMEEKISVLGIFAIFLVIFGGLALWIGKGKINWKMIGLMIASSALCAWNDVILAEYGRELFDGITINSGDIKGNLMYALPAVYADLAGKVFFGMIFLLRGKVRREVKLELKSKFGLALASTLLYDLGDVIFDIAKLFAPVAIVQAFACTQPLFVLIIAVVCAIYLKDFMKSEVSRTNLLQKVIGISLMVIGGIILSTMLG